MSLLCQSHATRESESLAAGHFGRGAAQAFARLSMTLRQAGGQSASTAITGRECGSSGIVARLSSSPGKARAGRLW